MDTCSARLKARVCCYRCTHGGTERWQIPSHHEQDPSVTMPAKLRVGRAAACGMNTADRRTGRRRPSVPIEPQPLRLHCVVPSSYYYGYDMAPKVHPQHGHALDMGKVKQKLKGATCQNVHMLK